MRVTQRGSATLDPLQAWRVELGEGYEVYLLPPSSESDIAHLKTRLVVKKAPTPQQPHTQAVPRPQQPHTEAIPTPQQPHTQAIPTPQQPHTQAVPRPQQPHSQAVPKPQQLHSQAVPKPQQLHSQAVPKPQQHIVEGSKGGGGAGGGGGGGGGSDSVPNIHVNMLHNLAQQHAHWELGALAELIHNADGADAEELKIEVLDDSEPRHGPFVGEFKCTLLFADNGKGMDREDMKYMMNLGHDLQEHQDRARANLYGMGFKTGSMANADEALVLSKVVKGNQTFGTVGILSKRYCVDSGHIATPILYYDLNTCKVVGDNKERFFFILGKYTPFTEGLLVAHFSKIKVTGTRVYLMKLKDGALDLLSDNADIRMSKDSDGHNFMQDLPSRKEVRTGNLAMDYSLRAYCEIMFRRPRMKIKLRGASVKQRDFLTDPNFREVAVETGCTSGGQPPCDCTKMHIGIDEKERSNGNCGIHMYWHNVLIVSFHKASFMVGNNSAVWHGITGIVELNHAQPTNNKQSFEAPRSNRRMILNLLQAYEATLSRCYEPQLSRAAPTQARQSVLAAPTKRRPKRSRPNEAEQAAWFHCDSCKKSRRPLRGQTESYKGKPWTCSYGFTVGDVVWEDEEVVLNSCSEPQEELLTWAQCDSCKKWRRALKGETPESLKGRNWYCSFGFTVGQNEAVHKLCDVSEEVTQDQETVAEHSHYGVQLSRIQPIQPTPNAQASNQISNSPKLTPLSGKPSKKKDAGGDCTGATMDPTFKFVTENHSESVDALAKTSVRENIRASHSKPPTAQSSLAADEIPGGPWPAPRHHMASKAALEVAEAQVMKLQKWSEEESSARL